MRQPLKQPGPRYHALLELLRISEALWESSRVFFAQWKLSPSQFNILNLLRGSREGFSQTALSRELIMHRSNVTGLVDRLEQRRLVRRKSVPGDRRAHRVVLTRLGQTLIDSILPAYYGAAEKVWGNLNARQANSVVKTLQPLCANALRIAQSGSEVVRQKQNPRSV